MQSLEYHTKMITRKPDDYEVSYSKKYLDPDLYKELEEAEINYLAMRTCISSFDV
jgi:hypothetical protein